MTPGGGAVRSAQVAAQAASSHGSSGLRQNFLGGRDTQNPQPFLAFFLFSNDSDDYHG